jgi:hypothetical protein
VPVMLCSTAGELCGGEALYCATGDSWDGWCCSASMPR